MKREDEQSIPQLRVGVSSGLYFIGRDFDLHNVIRKLGYTLTRGVDCMELASDVPNEAPYTFGKTVRAMAKKQGVIINFHGDLNVPIGIPERSDWRDAFDRMTKSIKSAVYSGAQYIDFHSSLNEWLELLTFTGRKLTTSFCDHRGKFISGILKENEKLREWFVENKHEIYTREILTPEELDKVSNKISFERRKAEEYLELQRNNLRTLKAERDKAVRQGQAVPPEFDRELKRLQEELDKREKRTIADMTRFQNDKIKEALKKKLAEGGKWRIEELRAELGILDGYHIMAHYLFYTKDPVWTALWDVYKKHLEKDYPMDYSDRDWVDNAWRKAEKGNDIKFKEFFYSAVAAKYLEGLLEAAFKWIDEELIKNIIPKEVRSENGESGKAEEEIEELKHIAENIIIGIENNEARQPEYGGRYLLWHPKQILAAIKAIRKELKPEWAKRAMMIMDFEQLATQAVDSLVEANELAEKEDDWGEYVISVHANHPNPLHAHAPLELGDELLYKLMWNLRKTGLGKKHRTFLIFERGGGDDPFKQSVDTLRLIARYLEMDMKPEQLPEEFFGFKGNVAGGYERQVKIIRDHAWEPLKDLLMIPDQDWTFLSSEALKKGKKPEQFKRGEFR